MMIAPTTTYLPTIFLPNDGEKYRLLAHHRMFGICPASRYQAMPVEMRPEHPQPIRNLLVKKSQPVFPRRMTFVRFLLGRLAAF